MLRKPLARKKVGERGFSVAAPAAWNDLPLSVKSSQSLAVLNLNWKLMSLVYLILCDCIFVTVFIFICAFICKSICNVYVKRPRDD